MKYLIEIGMMSHAGSYRVGPFKSEAIARVWFDNTFDDEGKHKGDGTVIRYAHLHCLNPQSVEPRRWEEWEGLEVLFD